MADEQLYCKVRMNGDYLTVTRKERVVETIEVDESGEKITRETRTEYWLEQHYKSAITDAMETFEFKIPYKTLEASIEGAARFN